MDVRTGRSKQMEHCKYSVGVHVQERILDPSASPRMCILCARGPPSIHEQIFARTVVYFRGGK